VSIQRHEKIIGGETSPEAEIEQVRASDHPTQIEVPSLARRTGIGSRQEMSKPRGPGT